MTSLSHSEPSRKVFISTCRNPHSTVIFHKLWCHIYFLYYWEQNYHNQLNIISFDQQCQRSSSANPFTPERRVTVSSQRWCIAAETSDTSRLCAVTLVRAPLRSPPTLMSALTQTRLSSVSYQVLLWSHLFVAHFTSTKSRLCACRVHTFLLNERLQQEISGSFHTFLCPKKLFFCYDTLHASRYFN